MRGRRFGRTRSTRIRAPDSATRLPDATELARRTSAHRARIERTHASGHGARRDAHRFTHRDAYRFTHRDGCRFALRAIHCDAQRPARRSAGRRRHPRPADARGVAPPDDRTRIRSRDRAGFSPTHRAARRRWHERRRRPVVVAERSPDRVRAAQTAQVEQPLRNHGARRHQEHHGRTVGPSANEQLRYRARYAAARPAQSRRRLVLHQHGAAIGGSLVGARRHSVERSRPARRPHAARRLRRRIG
ncbi:tssM domain protein [Burkholderia mallei]|nr:tssM domain protein [Burkholderia mallei]